MKVLLCHNFYQQPGGEDHSFCAEADLLAAHGHDVLQYTLHNDAIRRMNRLSVAAKTLWNRDTYREVRALVRRERPAVLHCTNTFPLISPAVYPAARESGAAVVQSLRNFRLFCANGLFHRDGRPCEDCLRRTVPWPALAHRCYRDSLAATATVAAMQMLQRGLGAWTNAVDRFIALSEFSRGKFISGGLPAERISLKPNFLPVDPGCGGGERADAIFVGRLSAEKGLATLLAAWRRVTAAARLVIVGDGPLAASVQEAAARDGRIAWLGHRTPVEVLELVGRAACLVLPSTCYENFPRSILEAYAKGTPVVASRRGAMRELVDDGRTGFHFAPGDDRDLAETLDKFFGLDSGAALRMREAARQEFELKYSAERNHEMLLEIYGLALRHRHAAQPQFAARPASQPATVCSSTAALETAGAASREVRP